MTIKNTNEKWYGVFLLIGFKKHKTNKQKTHTATQLCAQLASKLTWNNYFNVYLCHMYKWQRILNHCDIDGISYCRILLLTNTRTYTNATTFSVENRLLGKEKSGRDFALSDADTLPQSNQASFSWIFAIFFRHELSTWIFLIEITHRKMVRSVCLKPVSMATWRLHTLWRFTFTAYGRKTGVLTKFVISGLFFSRFLSFFQHLKVIRFASLKQQHIYDSVILSRSRSSAILAHFVLIHVVH